MQESTAKTQTQSQLLDSSGNQGGGVNIATAAPEFPEDEIVEIAEKLMGLNKSQYTQLNEYFKSKLGIA